jgi:2,5-diketo-D-gluconate reductase B
VARERSTPPVVANQVEMHPLLHQEEMCAYVREHDMTLVAYAPLAKGEALDLPEVRAVAERHGATPAQVCLAWLHAKENVVPIPGIRTRDHLAENYAALDLALDESDVARIDGIERERRVYPDPRDIDGVE